MNQLLPHHQAQSNRGYTAGRLIAQYLYAGYTRLEMLAILNNESSATPTSRNKPFTSGMLNALIHNCTNAKPNIYLEGFQSYSSSF